MAHDGKQVANHVLEIASNDGRSLDIMTLLKLSYFAHGWCLAAHDEALVTDRVEAWRYGPVIPGIYYGFRPQGIDDLRPLDLIPEEIGADFSQTIKAVYHRYQRLSGRKMSGLTHKKDGPWYKIYKSLGEWKPNTQFSNNGILRGR